MMRRTRKGREGGAASPTTISHLPVAILVEIFLKVTSLHALLCCSRVCKSWRRLVFSKEFTKTHLSQSNYFLILGSREGLQTISKKLILVSPQPNPQLEEFFARLTLNLPSEEFQITDSCNGFLCLTSPISIEILNPMTGECIMIPRPDSFSHNPVMYGEGPTRLGFCSSTNECKVVRIVPYCFLRGKYCGLEIYTIGKGGWRYRKDSLARWVNDLNVFLNGNVIWFHRGKGLFAFNFDDEQISPIPLPEASFKDKQLYVGILDCQLCVYTKLDVWVMLDYGNQASWMKKVTVADVNVGVPYRTSLSLDRAYVWCIHGTDAQHYATIHKDIIHVKSTYPWVAGGKDVAVSYIPSFVSMMDFVRRNQV